LPPLQGALTTAGDATGVGEVGAGVPVVPQASRMTGNVSAMKVLLAITAR
jgi:hypothetical protein